MTKIPVVHFEAKKHAYRQTQDGIVVSFVIHPDEVNADFAVAPLGTRFMVVVSKIGDDERPEPIRVQTVDRPANDPAEARTEPEAPAIRSALQDEPPERRRFSELPLPQQVALRCNDERFQTWIMADDADHCARLVRERCEVVTRADINPDRDPVAVRKWFELERDFLISTGQMAEERR